MTTKLPSVPEFQGHAPEKLDFPLKIIFLFFMILYSVLDKIFSVTDEVFYLLIFYVNVPEKGIVVLKDIFKRLQLSDNRFHNMYWHTKTHSQVPLWFNTSWCYIQHCKSSNETHDRQWTHERHPAPVPHRRDSPRSPALEESIRVAMCVQCRHSCTMYRVYRIWSISTSDIKRYINMYLAVKL